MANVQNKVTHFSSDGRLLLELGERLVAKPEVAVLELIKNAYDADSAVCEVKFLKNAIVIQDSGNGITESDFQHKWMTIATDYKAKNEFSSKYHRPVTGAKGIGRFATRFLGHTLKLETVATDKENRKHRLCATFDWVQFDTAADLSMVEVPYTVQKVNDAEDTGTKLTIENLQDLGDLKTDDGLKKLRTQLLNLVSPLSGLNRGHFDTANEHNGEDPGFKVDLGIADTESNIASDVLDNAWARVYISLNKTTLKYKVFFNPDILPDSIDSKKKRGPYFTYCNEAFDSKIKSGLYADIRFFPRRPGLFAAKNVNGFKAKTWVAENVGVVLVDHGFRMKPYGDSDDDWLRISHDKAINKRDKWYSSITNKVAPIPDEVKNRPADNPMMYLPRNQQLVGAVFVSSRHTNRGNDLIPSMDREGFIANESFKQLVDIVRAGIEFLAICDKEVQSAIQAQEAREASIKVKQQVAAAINYVSKLPTLSTEAKKRLVTDLSSFNHGLAEIEDYNQQARQNIQTMSLLGVIAGFMTHESERILSGLDKAILCLEKLQEQYPSVGNDLDEIKIYHAEFKKHVDYTGTFIRGLQRHRITPIYVASEVENIIEMFRDFVNSRGIITDVDIDPDLESPKVSVPLYSGVLVNLYTNAMKAVLSVGKANHPMKIKFKAWNDAENHYIEVHDNGVGLPPELEHRIWEPLFSTTSKLQTPLGTGMGLGLSLVKDLTNSIQADINLSKPDSGFSTCFRLTIPFQVKGGMHK